MAQTVVRFFKQQKILNKQAEYQSFVQQPTLQSLEFSAQRKGKMYVRTVLYA